MPCIGRRHRLRQSHGLPAGFGYIGSHTDRLTEAVVAFLFTPAAVPARQSHPEEQTIAGVPAPWRSELVQNARKVATCTTDRSGQERTAYLIPPLVSIAQIV